MNDTNEEPTDLQVNSDGLMGADSDSIAIQIKSAPNAEPEVNKISPPPAPVVEKPRDEEQLAREVKERELRSNPSEDTIKDEAAKDQTSLQSADEEASNSPQKDGVGPSNTTKSIKQESLSQQHVIAESDAKNLHSTSHEHRNDKKMVAMIIVTVALLLAGVAVYLYASTQDNATETSSPIASEEVEPATTEDIDQVLSEIDAAVESLDESEFVEESLSDEILEL